VSHPNRMEFYGVLAFVDEPSDKATNGSRGHKISLKQSAVEEALPSLLGMPVNCRPSLDGHDVQRVVGVIDSARLDGNSICITGHLFPLNFSDLHTLLATKSEELGMSYEIQDAHIDDTSSDIWTVVKLTFTGATVQKISACAYKRSSFSVHPTSLAAATGKDGE